MPTIHLDFSGIEEFEPLPKGVYPVVIESVELRESTQTPDSYYLNWTLIVTDGEYEGRKIWYTNGLTEKSMYYLHEQFLDLAVIGEEDTELDLEIDEDTNFLISPEVAGIGCLADVGTQVRNGKLQNAVNRLYLEGDLPFEPDPAPKKKVAGPASVGGKTAPKTPAKKGPKFR
jgi:hypothetical protein